MKCNNYWNILPNNYMPCTIIIILFCNQIFSLVNFVLEQKINYQQTVRIRRRVTGGGGCIHTYIQRENQPESACASVCVCARGACSWNGHVPLSIRRVCKWQLGKWRAPVSPTLPTPKYCIVQKKKHIPATHTHTHTQSSAHIHV